MNRFHLLLAAPLFCSVLTLSVAEPPATAAPETAVAPLWRLAVAIAEENRFWVPGEIHTLTEEAGRRGTTDTATEFVTRLLLLEDGDIREETFRIVDSREVPYVEEHGEEDWTGEPWEGVDFWNPTVQERIEVTGVGDITTVVGRRCLPHAFVYRNEEEGFTMRGTAWLDETTGTPTLAEYTDEPLPRGVSEMSTVVTYYAARDAWYPRSVTVEGVAQVLFIKRDFRIEMNFRDYWEYPTGGDAR